MTELKSQGFIEKIKDAFKKFDQKCMEMSDFKFTFTILGIIVILLGVTIAYELMSMGSGSATLPLPEESVFDEYNIVIEVISLVIIVPYVETIIFHVAPLSVYYFFKRKLHLDTNWDFIVGGLVGLFFGLLHGRSYQSISKGFNFIIIGWLFSYVFFRYRRLDKKSRHGLWIIHALQNFLAILPLLIVILFE